MGMIHPGVSYPSLKIFVNFSQYYYRLHGKIEISEPVGEFYR